MMVDLFPIHVPNMEEERQLFFRGMAHAHEMPQDKIIFRTDADAADYDLDINRIVEGAVVDGFSVFPELIANPRFDDMGNIHPRLVAQSWGYCRILRDIANSSSPVSMMIHDDAALRVSYQRLVSLGYKLFELPREFYMLQMGIDIDIFPPNAWNTPLVEVEDTYDDPLDEMLDTQNPLRIFRHGIRAYYDCGWLFSPVGANAMLENFNLARCWKFETGIGYGAHEYLRELTENGCGIYTSRDNDVTLTKRNYDLGSLTSW